jgi:ABC-type antimicrobial peptide transport system permease subunit
MATLSGFFGALASVLAMIGLYGVISYMVIRRTNEIGIRMALGAKPRGILIMVLRDAASLLGIGLAIGTVLAVLGATAARLLFGLRPSDPTAMFIAIAMLAVVAIVAGPKGLWGFKSLIIYGLQTVENNFVHREKNSGPATVT